MTLTSHGRLVCQGYTNPVRPDPSDVDLRLDVNFVMHAYPEDGGTTIFYRVFLDEGQVALIRPCNRLGVMGARRFRGSRPRGE
jgi:hypothetical protein